MTELANSLLNEQYKSFRFGVRFEVASDGGGGAPPVSPAQPVAREAPGCSEPEALAWRAAREWMHRVLHAALRQRCTPSPAPTDSDLPARAELVGLGINAMSVLRAMHAPGTHPAQTDAGSCVNTASFLQSIHEADPAREPLAAIARRLALSDLELCLLVLAVSPDVDVRYQRCMAVLMDDASRRIGTLGLYCDLLGEPASVAAQLHATGKLVRWHLLACAATLPPADEPLRADMSLTAWLLGNADALETDPSVQRLLRSHAWRGAELIGDAEALRASSLIHDLRASRGPDCIVLLTESSTHALALLERGAELGTLKPLRVELQRLSGLDSADVEEAVRRLARAALLTDRPLVLNASGASSGDAHTALALATLASTGCRFGIVGTDLGALVSVLADGTFTVEHISCHGQPWTDTVLSALTKAGASPGEETIRLARLVAASLPMEIDDLAAAGQRARVRAPGDSPHVHNRFLAACRDVTARGVSKLADRIDPVFTLDDVVLPQERARQLQEIVASVRLAPKVLDHWGFRRQLPYGRGTIALLHGPSGSGKTMAAHALARALNVQLLRLDLSRVVSKYIGETEKNCDRIFDDATRSGAAILIDEADALFGKRSEVRDAHDRHANIEVAFLLQRIEAFDGLAILTTNLRQNIDAAFLRRLRFIVEFPWPDVDARTAIWAACLPAGAHAVSQAELGELARRIDLTGGHIRQITLRAAFLAADRDELIDLRHLTAAAHAELDKLGMPVNGLGAPRLEAPPLSSRHAA